MQKTLVNFLLLTAALFLVSCQGGGGDGSPGVNKPFNVNPGNDTNSDPRLYGSWRMVLSDKEITYTYNYDNSKRCGA